MTYYLANTPIRLASEELSDETKQAILSHPLMFRVCLNLTLYNYITMVKKVTHLMCDVLNVYATLLEKIPHYDDITDLTRSNKVAMTKLEEHLNRVFGEKIDVTNMGWEEFHYEEQVKAISKVIIEACLVGFSTMYNCFNCIDVFFLSFDNLKKLLIPCLLPNTIIVRKLLVSVKSYLNFEVAVDEVATMTSFDVFKHSQLAKIETITIGLEREARLLSMAFKTLDQALTQYTSILLGKAILKRDIEISCCQLIRRRDICSQAAEQVVSIPLTGEQYNSHSLHNIKQYLFCGISLAAIVVGIVSYRIYKLLFA